MVCLLALGGVRADAKTIYSNIGSFGTSGEFSAPQKLAVDYATGDILVVDAAGKVDVFAPAGNSAVLLTSFGAGELSSPYGIAVDQSTHDVYVSDAGNSRVVRYSTDGLPTPTYTLDALYTGPVAGNDAMAGEVGSFTAPLAVDPTTGDLLLADSANHAIDRYSSSGAFLDSFDGSDSEGGAFHNPLDLTVDSNGNIDVVDFAGEIEPLFNILYGTSRVLRLSPAGVAQGSLGSPNAFSLARSIAFEPVSGNTIVTTDPGAFGALETVHVFHGAEEIFTISYPEVTSMSAAVGIAATGDGSGRVYGLTSTVFFGTYGFTSAQVLAPVVLPDVVLEAPSMVTTTGARLLGSVNPLGVAGAEYHFEYSSDGVEWISTPSVGLGSDSTPVAVQADVSGLDSHRVYQMRLSATNPNGTNVSGVEAFTTLVAVPLAVTGDASDLTSGSATLNGSVNALGGQTSFYFEYGPTTAYGSRAPAGFDSPAGQERTPREHTRAISGLEPASVYHYRLVAKSSAGTAYGTDRSFTTRSVGGVRSAYELVSPVQKDGSQVSTYVGYQASFDGSKLAYLTQSVFGAPGNEGAPFFARYVATRGDSGWATNGTDPPILEYNTQYPDIADTIAVSDDGTKAVVISTKKLTPGAVEGDSNTYMRDVATGAYTLIAIVPGHAYYLQQRSYRSFFAANNEFEIGTSDFGHLLLYGDVPLLPGAPVNSTYDYTDGQLRLVTLADDGKPMPGGGVASFSQREPHSISEDGSKIFFASEGAVFVRVDGTSTFPVSVSQRAGDLGAVRPGIFLGASSDGRVVLIESQDLSDDSEPGVRSLYRYDSQTHALELLAAVPGGVTPLQLSANGEAFYFKSTDVLAAGGVEGAPNTYVWRAAHFRLVATPDGHTNEGRGIFEHEASPNGRYFAFVAYGRLTAYENSSNACSDYSAHDPGGACSEVYRYDGDTGTVTCASCRRDGGHPTGNAKIGEEIQENAGHHFPQVMFDDGTVFFETPDPVAAKDVNAALDVYSFDGEQASLVSAGTGSASYLADVSGDERNVFFATQNKLVAVDTDRLMDVYDARVEGGIDAQNPPPPRPECTGEACLGVGLAPEAPPAAGSVAFEGPGNISPETGPLSARAKVSRTVKGPVFSVSVKATSKGHIAVSGRNVKSASRTVGRPGSYRVRVELSRQGRRALKQRRVLRLRLRVRVVYAGGKVSSESVLVTVKA